MHRDRVSYTLDSTLETVNNAEETASRLASEVGLPPIRKSAFATFLASNEFLFQIVDRIGLIRIAIDLDLTDFPADAVAPMRTFLLDRERARTAVRELNSVSDTLGQIGPLRGLSPMPVTVIAADRWIDKDPDLSAMRADRRFPELLRTHGR